MNSDSSSDNKKKHTENALKPIEYKTNGKGDYQTFQSEGWEPGDIAHEQAWKNHHKRIEQTLAMINDNQLSPIAYYMEKNLMTPRRLAGYSGLKKRTVKKHLKAKKIKSIPEDTLKKYANVFDIPVNNLINFNPESIEKNKD